MYTVDLINTSPIFIAVIPAGYRGPQSCSYTKAIYIGISGCHTPLEVFLTRFDLKKKIVEYLHTIYKKLHITGGYTENKKSRPKVVDTVPGNPSMEYWGFASSQTCLLLEEVLHVPPNSGMR